MRFAWLVALSAALAGAQPIANLRGIVRDAQTGEPLGRVRIQLLASTFQTTTDAQGRFELAVPPGGYTVQVSTVGYRVEKQDFDAAAEETKEFEVALSPDMFRHVESVEVHADPFEPLRSESPSEQTLLGSEVKNLASVLADDPLRAVQALPGVTSDDDFNARFAVRGAGYDRVGLFLDGVLLHAPFHAATEQGAAGTLTIFNGDFVEALSLETGAWPARYGDRTAAVLDVRLREGGRKQASVRGTASASNAGLLGEGPLGEGRGSWLASIRKSYLQYIVKRVSDDPTMAGGFWDAQGRVSYDLGRRHNLALSAIEGHSGLDRSDAKERLGLNSLMTSNYHFTLATLGWHYTPSDTAAVSSRGAFLREKYDNLNRDLSPLVAGQYGEWVWNTDATWAWRPQGTLEAGYSLRRPREDGYWNFYEYGAASGAVFAARRLDEFGGAGRIEGAYVQQAWAFAGGRLRLAAGLRRDRQTATGFAAWSPQTSAAVSLTGSTRLQLGWGECAQFADPRWVYSKLGGRGLLPARAIHFVAAIEQRMGERSRLRFEAYQRLDRDLLFRPYYEPRLIGGWIFDPPPNAPALNSLRGYARGFEVLWQRRSANRFAGWISYALGYARMRDGVARISFPADEDQRHTVNAYGSYRVRPTVNLSGRWMYGSGLPVPGFFSYVGGAYHLAEERNAVRLEPYQRTDVRVNKAFVYRRWKLTLYAEVINLFNRDNRRYDAFWGYNSRANIAYPGFNRMFPVLPSAGVVVEY